MTIKTKPWNGKKKQSSEWLEGVSSIPPVTGSSQAASCDGYHAAMKTRATCRAPSSWAMGCTKVSSKYFCHFGVTNKQLDRWIKWYDLGWHIFLKDMIIKLKFSGATVGAKVPKDVREELADPPSITVDLDLLGLVQVNALTQHELVEVPDLPWTWHGQTWSNPSRGQCDECESLIKQVPVRENQQWNGMC